MKNINKTKLFTIFVAVVMAITATSCLDPLDSVDGMPNASVAPLSLSINPAVWEDMCRVGEINPILDRFSHELMGFMSCPTFANLVAHELLYKRRFLLARDLADEWTEFGRQIWGIWGAETYFFRYYYPDDIRISLIGGSIWELRDRYESAGSCIYAFGPIIVYRPCEYNPCEYNDVTWSNVLPGYKSGIDPHQIDCLESFDGIAFLVELNIATNGILDGEINDPYAIHNMQQARLNLMEEGIYIPEFEANKRYIRFLPRDEYELDLLTSDSTFILFEFPLHYEIRMNETCRHHNSNLPEGAIPWQYVVVPIYRTLPNVRHELLYYVFIPDLNSDEPEDYYYYHYRELLIHESYRLTGNNDESGCNQMMSTRFFRPSRWHASGRITMWDDNLGTIPIHGVTVVARSWARVEEAITDRDGRFHAGRFIYNVTYSIRWSRHQYSIRAGTINQAVYIGPTQRREWNLHLDDRTTARHRLQRFYATIHRAAHHYYYRDIRGLRRPPQNGFLRRQMRIAAVDNSGGGRFSPVLPNQIKIWNPDRESMETYAITIHELAHASHWNMIGTLNYALTSSRVKESWANGVMWELTRMVYPEYRGFPTDRHRFPGYTNIVIDMIDTQADNASNNGVGEPHDRVEGYTIRQIEDALSRGIVTWNNWRNNMKIYSNETRIHLDALFDFWGTQ